MRSVIYLAVIVLAAAMPVEAVTINVPGEYTIQGGVDAAGAGDTVLVAAGVYDSLHYPPGTDTTRCVVYMKSGVTLLGSGQGTTIIDARNEGRGIYCHGVTNARIESFTVTHAFAQVYAAGIYCAYESSPTITDCEITDCGDGGIICNYGSSPEISYCQITNNHSKQGGGIAMEDSSSATVTHCTIKGNSAPGGGGVFVRNLCEAVFEDCVIDSNFLTTINGSGGAIAASNTELTIRRCSVNDNVSSGPGGGIDVRDYATAIIESTYIQNNRTTDDYGPGGGVYCELSDISLEGCTITGNLTTAAEADGGGLFLFATGTASVRGCTIAGNGTITDPDSLGGGVTCFGASPTIENTIIAFNDPGRGIYCLGGTPIVICTDVYGNEDGDAVCGIDSTGNFSEDPIFCDMGDDDYTLRGDSPCLPGNHPHGAPCGLIGAHGEGCEIPNSVPRGGYEEEVGPVMWHFASPNPFGPGTTIHFAIRQPGDITLAVYSVDGRRVRLLEDRSFAAGEHHVAWDSRNDAGQEAPSGVYFYRLGGSVPQQTGRLVLTR